MGRAHRPKLWASGLRLVARSDPGRQENRKARQSFFCDRFSADGLYVTSLFGLIILNLIAGSRSRQPETIAGLGSYGHARVRPRPCPYFRRRHRTQSFPLVQSVCNRRQRRLSRTYRTQPSSSTWGARREQEHTTSTMGLSDYTVKRTHPSSFINN